MRRSRPGSDSECAFSPGLDPEGIGSENAAMLDAASASIIQSERFMNQAALESCAE
jgi:hypothetical protein